MDSVIFGFDVCKGIVGSFEKQVWESAYSAQMRYGSKRRNENLVMQDVSA